MRNLCSIILVFMFMATGSLTWAAGSRKNVQQPDRGSRQNCQRQLRPPSFDSYGNEQERPGYSNSFEEDRRRYEPGPDEVEDRNPDEHDARDPGGF